MLTKNHNPRFSYISRILFIPLVACLVMAFSVRTQPTVTLQYVGEPNAPEATSAFQTWHLLRPDANAQRDTVPAATKKPKEISVKNDQIEVLYEDGTRATLTLAEANAQGLNIRATRKDSSVVVDGGTSVRMKGGFDGLVMLDGEEYKGDLNKLDPQSIASINVLKDAPAIQKYGDKGKKGVIEITLKHPTTNSAADTIKPKKGEVPQLVKVEKEAQFPGGTTAWRKFLETNLKAVVPVDHGAPAGSYTVLAQLLIDSDGTLLEVKPLSKHGFGMEEEVVRTLKLSPKWIPAQYNGRAVKAYRKQPITFVVTEADTKEAQPPVTLQSGATLSVAQLQAVPFSKLIKPEASVTLPNTNTTLSSSEFSIYSGAFTIDGDGGTIHEASIASEQPSNRIQSLIAGTVSGRLITIDRRVGVTKDGKQFKLPSLVYFIK